MENGNNEIQVYLCRYFPLTGMDNYAIWHTSRAIYGWNGRGWRRMENLQLLREKSQVPSE
jgi:hypothetical protein